MRKIQCRKCGLSFIFEKLWRNKRGWTTDTNHLAKPFKIKHTSHGTSTEWGGSPAGKTLQPHHKTQKNISKSLMCPLGLKTPQIQIRYGTNLKNYDPWDAPGYFVWNNEWMASMVQRKRWIKEKHLFHWNYLLRRQIENRQTSDLSTIVIQLIILDFGSRTQDTTACLSYFVL